MRTRILVVRCYEDVVMPLWEAIQSGMFDSISQRCAAIVVFRRGFAGVL